MDFADFAAFADMMQRDEINLVAACLDAKTLGAFACTCHAAVLNLRSTETLYFLTQLRGLESSLGISSVQHLEVAETVAQCKASIFFGWGSMSVDASANASLQRLATLLHRHPAINLSIEAHCGLEAHFAMPMPGQARDFTRGRAEAVREALCEQASLCGRQIDPLRVRTRAWGCSRPLVWCYVRRRSASNSRAVALPTCTWLCV